MLMKGVVTVLSGLVALALLSWGFHEHRQSKLERVRAAEEQARADDKTIADLRGQIEERQRAADAMKLKIEAMIAQLTVKLADKQVGAVERQNYENKIKELNAKLAQTVAAKGAPKAGGRNMGDKLNAGTGKSPMAGFATMMKNPAMRKMALDNQKPVMDRMYGSLYGLLNLPSEKEKAFKALLEKRQTGHDEYQI